MRHFSAFMLVALAGACTQDLAGAPCPCTSGYVCCASANVCLPAGAVCPSPAQSGGAGSGGGASGEGGAPSGGRPMGAAGDGLTRGGEGAASAGGGANETASGGAGNTAFAGRAGAGDGGGGAAAGSAGSAAAGNAGETGSAGELGPAGAAGAVGAETPFALVPTEHNDNGRTGANLSETALDAANVRVGSFGELSRRPLRGATFAQPLVAPDVELGDGSRRDVLVVATMANVVYALDARHPEAPPLWTRELGPSIELPTEAVAFGALGIWHEIGILGTPVLSPEENALYAVAASRTGDVFAHTVYKLSLATGEVLKSATLEAEGFDSAVEAQRAALTLSEGVLYVPFGAYAKGSAASGWMFAFDRDLVPLSRVNLGAPSGSGVTMSGDGPAVDPRGSLYFTTGLVSSAWDAATLGYGVRLLELAGTATPEIVERLVPDAAASGSDELASSGPLLLPGANRAIVAGQHRLYVVDTLANAPSPPLQELRVSGSTVCELASLYCDTEPSSPVFWPGSGAEPVPRAFVWSPSDLLRSFRFDTAMGRFDCDGGDAACSPLASAPAREASDAQNKTLPASARLTVSSRGTQSGSGVVWAVQPYAEEWLRSPDGILRAFDAERLKSLWSSERAKEPLGAIARGTLPTVSGGQVFVGTADGLSNKTTFWDAPTGGPPALASDDELLVVAWAFLTPTNQGFQLAWSSDGVTFDGASTIFSSFLTYEPALAANDGRLYFAWTGPEQRINVVASDDPSFEDRVRLLDATHSEAPFDGEAISGPALAYGDEHLFLAWYTQAGLEFASSADGVTFDPATHRLFDRYLSYFAPLVTYVDGKLYLATPDSEGRVNLLVSDDDGAHFDEPLVLPVSSAGHPALVSFEGPEPTQVLLWTSPANPGASFGQIAAATRSGSAELTRLHVFQEDSAEHSISAARFHGSPYIAWMGTSGAAHPNVARYSTGELVTYGLRQP